MKRLILIFLFGLLLFANGRDQSTPIHPNPAQELKNRILSNLPTENCTPEDCFKNSAPRVGTQEYTYSSIVSTFQRNRNQIFNEPIRHLSTLIVTDAAPIVEPYSVEAALRHIESFIPLDRFSNTSLSHENWNRVRDPFCTMDLPGRMTYTTYDLQNLSRFSHDSHGFSFNICESRSKRLKERLEQQIEDFLNEVILKGCLLIS